MSSLLVRMVTTITLMVAVPSMRQYSGRFFVSIVRTEAFVPVRRYTPSMRVVGSTNHAAQQRHNHTSSSSTLQHNNSPRHIRILGGGLAGLSMAYHLLSLLQQQQQPSRFDITIYDTAHEIGTGGASAVAGGYVVILCISSCVYAIPVLWVVNDDSIYLLLLIGMSLIHMTTKLYITKITETTTTSASILLTGTFYDLFH